MTGTITLPRATVQQALEALEEHGAAYMHHEAEYRKAITALKAALEQPELCSCGDRAKDQCPGEWEPGCDLGNNPAFARRVPLKQEPVAWMTPPGSHPGSHPGSGQVAGGARLASRQRRGVPLQRLDAPLHPPAPPRREWQSLTEEEIRHFAWNGFLMAEGIWDKDTEEDLLTFTRAIEAALKERNA